MSNVIHSHLDGTGKNLRYEKRTDVTVGSEVHLPPIGTTVYGSVSKSYATLSGAVREGSRITYYLKDCWGLFVEGENLTNQNGSIVYGNTVLVVNNVYTQSTNLADADVPEYTQKVDIRGAALTTFPEGTPHFDAFGRMQVGQMQAVGEYVHVGEDLAGKYWTQTVGGGAVTHDAQSSSMVFHTGTAAGDIARRTTNQYHPYKPGTSQLIYMSMAIGDSGKANVVREWGYFDNNNGVGFRLSGTQLQVFQRSSVSGTVVDTVVNQDEWSDNTLTDPVQSDFFLDATKGNIYWIDFEWLGMGRVRLGVFTPDGRRITCHAFQNANHNTVPYMRSGTLPLTWAQKNVNSVASASEMRLTCAVVFTETADLLYTGKLIHINPPKPITLTNSDKYVPFLSFKAKSIVNGIPNTIVGIHETFDWCSIGNSPLHVGIFVFPNESYLTNHNWTSTFSPGTMLYVDTNGTAIPQIQTWNGMVTGLNGSIDTDILTVTSLTGTLDIGHVIVADGVTPETIITGFITGSGGVGTYRIDTAQTATITDGTAGYPIKPIESFIAPANGAERTLLGDRMEKSFGLGGNLDVAEGDKPVFVFAAKVLNPGQQVKFFYTKYWKEIR